MHVFPGAGGTEAEAEAEAEEAMDKGQSAKTIRKKEVSGQDPMLKRHRRYNREEIGSNKKCVV